MQKNPTQKLKTALKAQSALSGNDVAIIALDQNNDVRTLGLQTSKVLSKLTF